MTTLCGISAWQYWSLPPVLRDVEIDPAWVASGAYAGKEPLARLLKVRSNAREPDLAVQSRLLTDLKGVSFPVDVMVDRPCSMAPNRITAPRKLPQWVSAQKDLVDLGAGLSVLSPEATLCDLTRSEPTVVLAKAMYEACGIFCIIPSNDRVRLVLNDLLEHRILTEESCAPYRVYAYSDERGIPLGDHGPRGVPLEWTPSFDRLGRCTDLWKRPPITSTDSIEMTLDRMGTGGRWQKLRRALAMTVDGAASPAEVRALIMLCAGARQGGESWTAPDLNRMVRYSTEASKLAGSSYCVVDALWPQKKVLEVLGEAYHADDLGFRPLTERTAALESMGYTVVELLHEQMSNLEFFDTVLPTIAAKLGFKPQRKTAAFLRRRDKLHSELFDGPYGLA